MPEDDVSDLRDVVDAINKLCETMKTSYDEYEDCEDVEVSAEIVDPNEVVVDSVETYVEEKWSYMEPVVSAPELEVVKPVPHEVEATNYSVVEPIESAPEAITEHVPLIFETCKVIRLSDKVVEPDALASEQVAGEPVPMSTDVYKDSLSETITSESIFEKVKTHKSERWSDPIDSAKSVVPKPNIEVSRSVGTERWTEEIEAAASDVETVQCEPMSEMYYTASSEVSLLSDVDFQDRAQTDESDKERDDRNSVMAGHVAAMRERFESMTRTNTPCPDLMRSTSPSFEVFRNISSSPDKLE